jgi:hypothetical protein
VGFKDLFKKKEPVKEMPGAQEIDSGLKYRDISITITFDPEQSKAHIEEDYTVLNKESSQNIHRQVKMLTSDSLNSILKAPVNILQICWKPVLCRYMSKTEKS